MLTFNNSFRGSACSVERAIFICEWAGLPFGALYLGNTMATEPKKRRRNSEDAEESQADSEDEGEDLVGPLPVQVQESGGTAKKKKGSIRYHVLSSVQPRVLTVNFYLRCSTPI